MQHPACRRREVTFLHATPRAPDGLKNAHCTRAVRSAVPSARRRLARPREPHPQQLPVTAHEDAHEVLAVPPLGQGQVAAVPGEADSCRGEERAWSQGASAGAAEGLFGEERQKAEGRRGAAHADTALPPQAAAAAGAPGHPHGGRTCPERDRREGPWPDSHKLRGELRHQVDGPGLESK